MVNLNFESAMFYPWIGKEYESGGIFKKKILILGESHYCDDCSECKPGIKSKCNNFTRNVIKEQFTEGKKTHAIFTKLAKLLLDKKDIDLSEKEIFWNSVSFYNYVQSSVGSEARIAPSNEMFSISIESFHEVMEKLDPDLLIIVSSRLWENLPGTERIDWPEGPTIHENNIIEKTWFYKGKRKNTLCVVIYHPSSSYFSYDYTPIVKKALSLS